MASNGRPKDYAIADLRDKVHLLEPRARSSGIPLLARAETKMAGTNPAITQKQLELTGVPLARLTPR